MSNNRNLLAVVSYITWIGFLIAYFMGRNDRLVMHHANQALVINLIGLIGGVFAVIPLLGAVIAALANIAGVLLDILGMTNALRGGTDPLPFIGDIHIIG